MTTLTSPIELFETLAEHRRTQDADTSLAALAEVRTAGQAALAADGLPQVGEEDWRYTNLAPWLKQATELHAAEATPALSADALAPYRFATDDALLLTFVNGRLAPQLCDLAQIPNGLQVTDLTTALRSPTLPHERLRAALTAFPTALTALNASLCSDAAVVTVRPGTVIERPIHVLHITPPNATAGLALPRTCILVGRNAQVQVVEQHVGLSAAAYWTNAATSVWADDDAVVAYVKLVREGAAAAHTASIHVQQMRNTQVHATAVVLSGRLVRQNWQAILDGEGADCGLHGLALLDGEQQVDNQLQVEHARPHGSSREIFRSIVNDTARSAFCGRIVVRPGAQKTDAKQTNQNLLLSDDAQAYSKPQLEIYADDVKCTHGATIGQVDEDAIFFLRSRGIGAEAARSMLVYAFARASLTHVPHAALRAQLDQAVLARLPDGALLRQEL